MPRVRVGVCSVGAELLSGQIVDSNSPWLFERVEETGASVAVAAVVDDDRDAIVETLRWVAAQVDVIVVSGGLGPTSDDLTRYAVADFAGVDVERREPLVQHLEERYRRVGRTMTEDALRQADIPAGAVHHDPLGTAAGFSMTVAPGEGGDGVRLHVLPGVPWEFKGGVEAVVVPELTDMAGGVAKVTRTAHVAGMGESAIAATLRPVTDRLAAARTDASDVASGIGIAFLARSDEVLVKVSATGPSPHEARERASGVFDECLRLLGELVSSIDDRRVEDEVVDLLVELDRSVAVVEGGTAGRVATALSARDEGMRRLAGGRIVPDGPGRLEHAALAADAERLRERLDRDGAEVDYVVVTSAVRAQGDEAPPTASWLVSGPDGTVTHERQALSGRDTDVLLARGAAFALEGLRRALLRERSSRDA